jgi:hypothetical protein
MSIAKLPSFEDFAKMMESESSKPSNSSNDNTSNTKNNENIEQPIQNHNQKTTEVPLEKVVEEFLSKNKVKLVIGTPCFGGMLHTGYFQAMIDLSTNFTKLGIPFQIINIGNESLITRARNGIVAKFLADPDNTHLLFIDADITFHWISVLRLLINSRDLSGGVYPKKHINWEKMKRCLKSDKDMDKKEIIARSVDYVFNPVYFTNDKGQMMAKVENGMVQVKDVPTGFMLIKRSVFDTLIFKFPERKYNNNVAGYHNDNTAEFFYNFFAVEIDPDAKVYLSEDYFFCKLWRECGGDLWVDLNTNLNHTGSFDYIGALALTIGESDDLNEDTRITGNTIHSK